MMAISSSVSNINAHVSRSSYSIQSLHADNIRTAQIKFSNQKNLPLFNDFKFNFQKYQTKSMECRAYSSSDSPMNPDEQVNFKENIIESESLQNTKSPSPSIQLPISKSSMENFEFDEETIENVESKIEQIIFDSRFLTIMAVIGSISGSFLCFAKGSILVFNSFSTFFKSPILKKGKVILLLVEALDVYLVGTVMLIFGIGIYELFVCTVDFSEKENRKGRVYGSSLFGLFKLKNRPRWLEIHSLDALKTKLGHVIVMVLLVNMFEKSKKAIVHTSMDLLFFSIAVFFSSLCLFVLSRLNSGQDLGFNHKD